MFILYFCSIHCDFCFLFSYFIWVFSLLFLVSPARGLSILFTFSKNRLLVWLIFVNCFLNLYFIDFLFDIYGFLPSADFRFCLFFFFWFFRWWVESLIWDFSSFLWKACIAMNFPLIMLLWHPIDFEWLCFHCRLSWGIFNFPFWSPHWPTGFIVACFFKLLVVSFLFFLLWFFHYSWFTVFCQFYTAQQGDPVTHTYIHSFFSHYHALS